MKYVLSNPSHVRKAPRKFHLWTAEDAAAFEQERGPVEDLFDHLLPWFQKTSDGEHLIIFSNGDYRWIRIYTPKKKGVRLPPAHYSWSSQLNKTPKTPAKRRSEKGDGIYADLLADKSVVASIWTSISGDALRFFCDYLLKKKPSVAKKFAATKSLSEQTQLLVNKYKVLTYIYDTELAGIPSKKERTLKSTSSR